jgi:hypothetical protein
MRKILIISNETLAGAALRDEVARRALASGAEVLVVCPALNSRLRHWLSDEDGARAAARKRLAESLAALAARGVTARGEIGDADPIAAARDALRTFPADEIVIATHPPGRSNWLEKDVVNRARAAFHVPVTGIVVDLEAERLEHTPSFATPERLELVA